ncbi:MAG: zinc-binding dehydrogenase, partial [Crocinitomicaceae bacterium]|nr:zinc-binding dehydrogenase [Crocinitomicaceae bacterium]
SSKEIALLANLFENGVLKPVIDKTFSLEKISEAHRYAETGHKKGNVAISIS